MMDCDVRLLTEEIAKDVFEKMTNDHVLVEIESEAGHNGAMVNVSHDALITAVMYFRALPAVFRSLVEEGINGQTVDPDKLCNALIGLADYMLNDAAEAMKDERKE